VGENAASAPRFQTLLRVFLLPNLAGRYEAFEWLLNLAVLPTQLSESSELCALGELFKVRLPLPISGRV
jgi:hypothetical protein